MLTYDHEAFNQAIQFQTIRGLGYGVVGIMTTASIKAGGLRLLLVNPTIVSKREHLHIGLATVGSYVKASSRHKAKILDFMINPGSWRRRLRNEIEEYRPDVVGMYISSPYFPAAREVAAEIKRLCKAPLVAGGHHPSLSPDSVLSVTHFDMLIEGEGEIAMVRLLDAIASGAGLAEVPGLWWRDGGGTRRNPKAPLLGPEEFPTIDWTLFDEETLRANFSIWGILPVMASRGCPARCSFCSITNIQRLYPGERFLRFRDPARVVDEIEADFERYRPMGLRTIYFYDLNFLMNTEWLWEFTREYKRRGLNRKLPWSAYTRPDHVTTAVLESLDDSGCVNLRIGIEAANPFMRNSVYRKNVSQDRLESALALVKELGISMTGYFMAGGPGERPEWLLESLELARHRGVEFPVFFLYKPLAGSDILSDFSGLGSQVREDADDRAADFLHGVSIRHRHIKGWQLSLFVLFTHLVFGSRMILWQIRRDGWRWPLQLARYMVRALGMGFSPYGAFTYFIYYGEDHLIEPFRTAASPTASRPWRAVLCLIRRILPHSGVPEPEIPPQVQITKAG